MALKKIPGVLLVGLSILVTLPAAAGQYATISDDVELYYEDTDDPRLPA